MEKKPIIIISEQRDQSTSEVIKWILHFKADVIRINIDDPSFNIILIDPERLQVSTFQGLINITKNSLVWFRRISLGSATFLKGTSKNFDDKYRIFQLQERNDVLKGFVAWFMNNCKIISSPLTNKPSKIDVLLVAQKLNLRTPDWIITDNKKDLSLFLEKHNSIVHKKFNHFSFQENGTFHKILTELFSKEEVNKSPDKFEQSFFQEYIDKKYEIRTFYWLGHFYSMAILSQNDPQTKIDFRNYNKQKPNRTAPFNLPKEYKEKLLMLSKKMNLDTGSFDTLVDEKGTFYFLEVNPIGQFGMVSFPCNYSIEKKIAQNLIRNSTQIQA